MANNRMFLVHNTEKIGVYLGKRMGYGWYGTPDDVNERILALYEYLTQECVVSDQDNFSIWTEDSDWTKCTEIDTEYGKILQFE